MADRGRSVRFVETGTATNDTATATKAAVAHRRNYLTAVFASYSAAAIGLLQIKKGTDVVAEHYVHNAAVIPLDEPIFGDINEAVSAELASGGGAVVGKVNLVGYVAG